MLKIKPFKQSYGMCGAASMKMVMDYYGIVQSEKYWAMKIANKIDPKTGKIVIFNGLSDKKMLKVAKSLGFKGVWKEESLISELRKYISKNIPVIVNWYSPEQGGHFSVVAGFEKDNILLADPYFGKIIKMSTDEFKDKWFDFIGPPAKKNLLVRPIVVWYK